MRITVGVTDNRWAAFLRADPSLVEANFWLPSGSSFKSLQRGDPFLFKTKAPAPALVGGGYYEDFLELRVSEAWSFFGRGNGVPDEAQLHTAIQEYRARTLKPYVDDPTIGCVMLNNLFFAPPEEELPEPPSWAHNIVTWKNYTTGDVDADYVEHAFEVLRGEARIDLSWEPDPDRARLALDGPTYGASRLVRQRRGQGAFRAIVSTAYDWTCAITGSKIAPALEAAHIVPVSAGGQHQVPNALLLRSDVHTLFDRGYLGIDDEYRIRVSPKLRTEFGNGEEFYEREAAGAVVTLPANDAARPDPGALAWHWQTVFKNAA